MKPAQWIFALVVLVGMVFAITIAMNFLGENDRKNENAPADGDEKVAKILMFPETSYRGLSGVYYEQETKHPGHHDYLFKNPANEEVTLGLDSVSCVKCIGVEVFLAPRETETSLEPSFKQLSFPVSLVAQQNTLVKEIIEKLQPVARLEMDKKEEVKIPPQAVGWLRLLWKGDQLGTELFWAKVWSKNKARTVTDKLEASVRLSTPVKFLETEIPLGEMQVEALQNRQKPKKAVFKFWSLTRPQLHPKATLLARWKPGEAPIVVGEPEPMKPEEIAALEMELQKLAKEAPQKLTCAYRLPVTLLDRSPDGKNPFPFGTFRTRIQVTFDDDGIDPKTLMINGKLNGDVRIGGGVDGRLSFGSFDAATDSNFQRVMLYSDVPGLELEIDRERTPAFLLKYAEIHKVESSGGETTWEVKTKVPKNSVTGQFPQQDSDKLFDCAVYVKTKGDSSRSLRIPADGVAVVK